MTGISAPLSFAICLLVSVQTCTCAPTIIRSALDSDYLSMPHDEVTTDMDYLDSIQNVLWVVNVAVNSGPEAVLKRFDNFKAHLATRLTDKSPATDRMVEDFIGLTRADEACRENLSAWFLARFQEIEVSKLLRNSHAFLDYMKFYGSKKFHNCALQARETLKEMESNEEQSHAERLKEVKQFFKQLVFLADDADDQELSSELSSRDATSSKWNVQHPALMLESGQSEPKAQAESRIDLLFDRNCASLHRNFGQQLDIINVAAGLNSNFDYFERDSSLKALNEMRRICLRRARQPSKWRANLRAQLGVLSGEGTSASGGAARESR